jgi:hypothetical protein
VPNLSFPLEVMLTAPTDIGPQPCGGLQTCLATRAVKCLPAASTCPPLYGLQLFRNPNGPASTPELVECR